MPRSSETLTPPTCAPPARPRPTGPRPGGVRPVGAPPVDALLRRHRHAGEALDCVPVTEGLLNRGFRLTTTRGTYFLKQHLDAATADRATVARQHRATHRLHALGLPVAPPLADARGRTVAVVGGHCYALHPWVEGRHRDGGQLSTGGCRRLGTLLGQVHTALDRVMDDPGAGGPGGTDAGACASADPQDTFRAIDELIRLVRAHRPRDSFDALAEHRLRERRGLLARHAHHRPPAASAAGWVHGDFHPLNLLYRGAEPAAIVDWDRLGLRPRAEEAVRAAAIFFVRPGGELPLGKVRAYARAYRRATGADGAELAAAAHRVWWERLNDFWTLRWRYQLHDRRADAQFPAVSALAVWWTREYEAVREAFAG
ncbi:phosphotransferase [Streptomyces sp. S1]|uniref:phosphotransferase n=1 Tax=unclassified Streptomyces TaxID=2593676 RepID=UPI000EF7D7B3|nr:phosphotransferase [Streptomyces sp. S1]